MEIQWYPGHMARAKRELKEILPLLDLIIEVTDARLPFSGRNPELPGLLGKKARILLLNKADLADPEVTAAWVKHYRTLGEAAMEFNARRGGNLSRLENLIKKEGEKILKRKPTLRLGVVGVPNCGKSSVLNRFVRRSAARVGEKPGVTRGRQWVKRGRWEILDTPGLLWPKIADQENGLKMALIGLIKPDLLNIEELVIYLLQWMQEHYPAELLNAYSLEQMDDPLAMLMAIGRYRGCLRKGGEVDLLRTADLVWSDFRAGRLGRISLERP
ncbi:MAG: ribosome biogenesis GTPase YlqF [Firmicutes bacterium]|nr:ribosome biogenesis GTPase YlqF [Bacillota bacterium]